MNKSNTFQMFFVTLFALTQVLVAQVINEVQSTQYKTLQSADRQYYDWIEIYNPTDKPIDLSGYGLSDSKKNPFKWTFPAETNIEAQGYLIVYASGLDKVTGNEIHSNFRLASDGETLRLFNKDSVEIDKVKIPPLQAEISWQRSTDGATVWAMSHKATPGASNHPSYATTRAKTPVFSHKGGFYTSAEQLKLEISSENEVRYTLDGTEPTEKSALYNSAISLDSTMFIRARTFKANQLPSLVVSHSYFIDTTFTVPVVSIQMDDFDLNDYEHGIYVRGGHADSAFPYKGANYWMDWERPVNFEFFEADTQAISQNVGLKIQGNYSRGHRQKSFQINARDTYGNPWLNYDFFKTTTSRNRYKKIAIRSGGSDTPHSSLRDAFTSQLVIGKVDMEMQQWKPCLLIINGENRGLYQLRDKINKYYLSETHEQSTENINILNARGEVLNGKSDMFFEFYNTLIDSAFENDSIKTKMIENKLDVQNFFEYLTVEMYAANIDWGNNNIKVWNITNAVDTSKWRWILYDIDNSYNFPGATTTYSTNSIKSFLKKINITPNIFNALMEIPKFKQQFVITFCDFLNTHLETTQSKHKLDSVSNAYIKGFDYQSSSKYYNVKPAHFYAQLDTVRTFISQRSNYMYQFLAELINIFETVELKITKVKNGKIKLSSSPYVTDKWSGKYFKDIPLTLTAIPDSGYQFVAWDEDIFSTDAQITVPMEKTTMLRANFKEIEKSVKIPDADIKLSVKLNKNYELHFSVANAEPFSYLLTNASGKVIQKGKKHSISNEYTIKLPQTQAGILILHIQQGTKRITHKFTKL